MENTIRKQMKDLLIKITRQNDCRKKLCFLIKQTKGTQGSNQNYQKYNSFWKIFNNIRRYKWNLNCSYLNMKRDLLCLPNKTKDWVWWFPRKMQKLKESTKWNSFWQKRRRTSGNFRDRLILWESRRKDGEMKTMS